MARAVQEDHSQVGDNQLFVRTNRTILIRTITNDYE
jgi:hypothetical protein